MKPGWGPPRQFAFEAAQQLLAEAGPHALTVDGDEMEVTPIDPPKTGFSRAIERAGKFTQSMIRSKEDETKKSPANHPLTLFE